MLIIFHVREALGCWHAGINPWKHFNFKFSACMGVVELAPPAQSKYTVTCIIDRVKPVRVHVHVKTHLIGTSYSLSAEAVAQSAEAVAQSAEAVAQFAEAVAQSAKGAFTNCFSDS